MLIRNNVAVGMLIIVIVLLSGLTPALSTEFPGASGMAKLDDSSMLIVQDTKIGQDGSPVGILTVLGDGGCDYIELCVGWPERQANDLESCFALPDRPGEFLLAESGSYNKIWYDPESELYNGRIFHLRVTSNVAGWSAEVLNTIPIPLDLHEVEGMVAIASDETEPFLDSWNVGSSSASNMHTGAKSYDSDYRIDSRGVQSSYGGQQPQPQMPGMAQENPEVDASVGSKEENTKPDVPGTPVVYTQDPPVTYTPTYTPPVYVEQDTSNQYVVILATRGAQTAYEQARLHWGLADLSKGTFDVQAAYSLPLYDPSRTPLPWQRGCSDIYLDEAGVIWVSTAFDEGDAGPFVSTVYRYGELIAVLQSAGSLLPAYSMLHIGAPTVTWEVAGVKIEALGAPMIAGSVLSFATDDEGYGGIWRPLGEAR